MKKWFIAFQYCQELRSHQQTHLLRGVKSSGPGIGNAHHSAGGYAHSSLWHGGLMALLFIFTVRVTVHEYNSR